MLVQIIEEDDLNAFKKHFVLENWKEPIASIQNYAVGKYVSQGTYDPADCFKYAIHCNSDEIVDFLLPQISVAKHGKDYGYPVLGMAIKNNRYDYASKIINHSTFDPYPMYHQNNFSYFNDRPDVKAHIDFLFEYLDILPLSDIIYDTHFKYYLCHLVCHNEETYNRLDTYLTQRGKEKGLPVDSVLGIYRGSSMGNLGEHVFSENYVEFIANKFTKNDISEILEHALKSQIYFTRLFESENPINALKILLQDPVKLEKNFANNVIYFDNLPLNCILLLEDNGISVWDVKNEKRAGIDFILKEDSIHTEKAIYFLENHSQQVLDRINQELELDGRDSPNVRKYLLNKKLQDNLSEKSNIKIHKI